MSDIGEGMKNIAAISKIVSESLKGLNERDAEIARLRETVRRLNRRCQECEAGLAEKVKASDGSLGRTLARAAWAQANRENERLREALAAKHKQVEWMEQNSVLRNPAQATIGDYLAARCKGDWETPCPKSEDRQHCVHWYDGAKCCTCGDAALAPPAEGRGCWISVPRDGEPETW